MGRDMRKERFSIVVPCYNEEGNVEKFVQEIEKTISDEQYEVIFVDDGSTDKTLKFIKEIRGRKPQIKYVSFSRNFGHQSALRAGLKFAKGEAVISMDADLQHPISLIPDMLKLWRKGNKIIYTLRRDTRETGFLKRQSSRFFYKFINYLSGLDIEEGAADFRLLDRKVVDMINQQEEADIFLRGYISWLGFESIAIEYTPLKRYSGSSKYSLKKMLKFALSGITQFSTRPLHLAYILSAAAFGLSFIYIIYAVWAAFSNITTPGWLSLVILIVFFNAFQFLLLGLIGEYVGRTFMQTKRRPDYVVKEFDAD